MTSDGAVTYDPTRMRSTRIPIPRTDGCGTRPPVPQRGAELLGALAPRRRHGRLPGRRALLQRRGRVHRSRRLRSARPPDDVVPGHGSAPARSDARARRPRLHPRRGLDGGRHPGPDRAPPRPLLGAGQLRLRGRSGGQGADGRHLRAARRAAGRSSAAPTPVGPADPPRRGRHRRPAGGRRGRARAGRLLRRPDRRSAGEPRRRPGVGTLRRRGRRRPADRRRDHQLPLPDGRRRQRDHHEAPGPRLVLGASEPRSARHRLRRPQPDPRLGRGDAALRHLEPDARPRHDHGADVLRADHPEGRPRPAARRVGQPRRAGLRRPRSLRPRPRPRVGRHRQLRRRPPLLHGCLPRPPGGEGRARRS